MQLRLAVIFGLFVAAWASGDDDHDDHHLNVTDCEGHEGHGHEGCPDHDDNATTTTGAATTADVTGASPSAVIAAPICAVAGMVTYSLM